VSDTTMAGPNFDADKKKALLLEGF
jgi:hypothetical protein